jgi:hypothetical protein
LPLALMLDFPRRSIKPSEIVSKSIYPFKTGHQVRPA